MMQSEDKQISLTDPDGELMGNNEMVLEAVQARLYRNPAKMRERRQTVEHPFGTIKSWMGATHFQMKTLKNVGTNDDITNMDADPEFDPFVLCPGLQHEEGGTRSGRWRLDGGDPGIGPSHRC
jgi:hypothetical protein